MTDPSIAAPTLSPTAEILRRVRRAWRDRDARAVLKADRRRLPAVLSTLAATRPDSSGWVVQGAKAGEPTLFLVGPAGRPAAAAIRFARTPGTRAGLVRAASALDALARAGLAGTIPRVLGRGADGELGWVAETALPGAEAGALIRGDGAARRAMLAAAVEAIEAVHGVDGAAIVIDTVTFGRWVDARVRSVQAAIAAASAAPATDARLGPAGGAASALDDLGIALRAELAGRSVEVGWIHGDLWPANVLLDSTGRTVTGIVDWDSAEPGQPPLHDLLHLALTTRRRRERRELGALVADLLRGGPWADEDRLVLGLTAGAAGDAGPVGGLERAAALWLYWLRTIEANLARHPGLARDRAWMDANVTRVLACR